MEKDRLIAINWCIDSNGSLIVDEMNMIQLFKADLKGSKTLKAIIKDYKRPSVMLEEDLEVETLTLVVSHKELYSQILEQFNIVFLNR